MSGTFVLKSSPRPPKLFVVLSSLTALGVMIPLVYLVLRALQADGADLREIVFRVRNLELLWNTLILMLGTLTAATLIALPLAFLTTRTNFVLRKVGVFLGVLPLAVPGYVGAYALLAASGTQGMIETLTGIRWPHPVGYWGALGVLTLFNFPYLFMNFWATLRNLDPSLEEAARSLGRSPMQVFWQVTLPQLRPAWYAGSLMIALHVFGDFGVVSLMRFETFSYAIYQQYNAAFDRVYAAWLSLMLLAVTASTLWLEARLLSRLRLSRSGSGAARKAPVMNLGMWNIPALVFVALVAGATLIVPLSAILFWLRQGIEQGVQDWGQVLWNSVQVALPASLLTTVLAIPPAYLGVRYPGFWTRLIERSAYFGYATPPLALALALVFFSLKAVPGIYQTLTLLIGAYVLHFLAEAIGPVRASLYQATPRLEEAARSLGYNSMQAFARVTFPLMRSGLLASLSLVFLSVLKELPLSFLLSPIGFETLAKNVWAYTSEAMFADAAPYAITIVLVSGLFAALVLQEKK
ncbi:ABC transporter permease [Deinococcus cellulosilyticus NBRC 106333 = KACC 11606]|uniref:ABC transporter permease n=2 Tax=Deinococcus cellulosilyticus TaxID=401558 RepID=A0A511NBC9_DEIC1|nr:ABC transporter permease [Deinococcus cellulosilyticus NBRC 106333 = KACC 11606]